MSGGSSHFAQLFLFGKKTLKIPALLHSAFSFYLKSWKHYRPATSLDAAVLVSINATSMS